MAFREYEIDAEDGRHYEVGASIEVWGDDGPRIDIEEVTQVTPTGATRELTPSQHPELVKEFDRWIEASLDPTDIKDIARKDDEAVREYLADQAVDSRREGF